MPRSEKKYQEFFSWLYASEVPVFVWMLSPNMSKTNHMLDITLKTFSECNSWIRTHDEDYCEIKLDIKKMEAPFDYNEHPN